MKKLSALICVQLWLIFCFSVNAQDFQKIADGVEHARLVRPATSADGKPENVVINLLRLDLTKVRLDVVHALDAAIGLEKTSSIATRYGAIAAINAGFFRIDRSIFEGDDVGILKIDGKILSESIHSRTALVIKNEKTVTQINFEKPDVAINLLAPKRILKISGINRERKKEELILYTPEFHFTTLTDNSGLEIMVDNGKIIQILDSKGSNRIPANGFVLSATGKFKEELKFLKIGDKLSVAFPLSDDPPNEPINSSNFKVINAEDIVSGAPQLIKNGVVDITWQQEKQGKAFVETHHPRTAVAKLKDGKFLMVTVDGRSEESGGMSLPDLAAFLLELGATDAMNLDGGGSTTMFAAGKIVNRPSDKEGERKVSSVVLVTPRR